MVSSRICLVHPQRGLCVMSYSVRHETSNFRSGTVKKGARKPRSGAAFQRLLCDAPVPDPLGEHPREVSSQDSPKPRVRLANGEERHPRLQRARPRRARRRFLSPQARACRLRGGKRRGSQGDAPPLTEGVRVRLSSLWTLEMAAEAAFERGLTDERVSGETIRATLSRLLSVRWMRAKRWITSPDPFYERKKGGATGC